MINNIRTCTSLYESTMKLLILTVAHALTFDLDLGDVLDLAELAGGDARVVVADADVCQHEHVLALSDDIFGRQLERTQAPLDVRHRRAVRDARQVDVTARNHLHRVGPDREVRRHATHCNATGRYARQRRLMLHVHVNTTHGTSFDATSTKIKY